jgi:hypothetical protein
VRARCRLGGGFGWPNQGARLMPRTGPWTPERDSELREYWAGDLSASQIGAKMAMNKNQIIGRAHRLKLPLRGVPVNISRGVVSRPAARAHRELPKLSETRAASPSRPRAASNSGALSSAVERQASSRPERDLPGAVVEAPPRRVFSHKQCQYITSSADRAHRFCEAPVVENAKGRPSPFCATHFELCLIPAKKYEAERKARLSVEGKDKPYHVTEKKVDWRHFYWPTGVFS